jgi:hypothetical protein
MRNVLARPESRRYTVQALNRAIDILMVFSQESLALSLGEVAGRACTCTVWKAAIRES